MKLTKTNLIVSQAWIIIAVVGLIAIWYFFLRKKGNGTSSKTSGGNSGTSSGTSSDLYIYAGYGIVSADKQPAGLTPIASFVGGKYYKHNTTDCPTPPCPVTKDQISSFDWNKLAQQYAKK